MGMFLDDCVTAIYKASGRHGWGRWESLKKKQKMLFYDAAQIANSGELRLPTAVTWCATGACTSAHSES
jgi:hypothetical protein